MRPEVRQLVKSSGATLLTRLPTAAAVAAVDTGDGSCGGKAAVKYVMMLEQDMVPGGGGAAATTTTLAGGGGVGTGQQQQSRQLELLLQPAQQLGIPVVVSKWLMDSIGCYEAQTMDGYLLQ